MEPFMQPFHFMFFPLWVKMLDSNHFKSKYLNCLHTGCCLVLTESVFTFMNCCFAFQFSHFNFNEFFQYFDSKQVLALLIQNCIKKNIYFQRCRRKKPNSFVLCTTSNLIINNNNNNQIEPYGLRFA